MASNGRHNYQSSTLALIAAGFFEFVHTSANQFAKIPFIHRSVAIGSLILSAILLAVTSSRKKDMDVMQARPTESGGDGFLHKIRKWTVVKITLNGMERLLRVAEYVITPNNMPNNAKQSPKPNSSLVGEHSTNPIPQEINGLPKLLNLRHISNATNGTPNNNQKPSDADDWTPFSSVSSVDESVFDRSCVSLMDDLSRTTISTPICDLRQQMAWKIRTWRRAIRDIDGTPEFPNWSPVSARTRQHRGFVSRVWNTFMSWMPFQNQNGLDYPIPGSGQRKRKRMEGDDEDLALFIPYHKGQPKQNGEARQLSSNAESAVPSIRGLSVIPVIGNWYSAEASPSKDEEQLDHIALIQRNFISPAKGASDSVSDSDPYEILDIDTKTIEEESEQDNCA